MNERINGLWWKARIGYNEQNCDPEVLAMFAELIVGECINTIRASDESVVCGVTVNVVIGDLKQHFGVEE